jgi:hypothetical protein
LPVSERGAGLSDTVYALFENSLIPGGGLIDYNDMVVSIDYFSDFGYFTPILAAFHLFAAGLGAWVCLVGP